MTQTVIKVENLSKKYRLGLIGSGTLKDDVIGWWYRMRGKPDPTLQIGQENQLDTMDGDYVWALRDINLEVKQGERLGIIGKNGAGKSTLLKILSRVTGPTTGNVKVKGRIASLLEVGTGFHPELTGRENIFLNGAILGMKKWEIKSKLDEIVDFAGVAKYLDTPVKRYSSGMYVRLAFAVAAHLEPDILIVDEVLAVGDAEFQQKAIGKMKDVSDGEGRTVLFVSHNMGSIRKLCSTSIFLKNGAIECFGGTDSVIEKYLLSNRKLQKAVVDLPEKYFNYEKLGHGIRMELLNSNKIPCTEFKINEVFFIKIYFKTFKKLDNVIAAVGLVNNESIPIVTNWSKPKNLIPGTYEVNLKFALPLKKCELAISVGLSTNERPFYYVTDVGTITIFEISKGKQIFRADSGGLFTVKQESEIQTLDVFS